MSLFTPFLDYLLRGGIQTPVPQTLVEGFCRAIVRVAEAEVGHGEVGENNAGPDVARYIWPTKPPANWCGGFSMWVIRQAAIESSLRCPIVWQSADGKRHTMLVAKTLGKAIAACGRRFTDPRQVRPGDFAVYDHPATAATWDGHIEPLKSVDADGLIHAIPGNSGAAGKAKVRNMTRDLNGSHLSFFASFRCNAPGDEP